MSKKILLYGKRGLVYALGLFIMAIGVVFSVKSALGVSPVTCLANVVHQISAVDMGVCTTLTYCFYILVEIVILRRDFKPAMLLQIVASTIFGTLVSLATKLFTFLPAPEMYIMRLVYLICSIPIVALGVMLYLTPQILPTPGEGLSIAISKKTGKSVANCKMITDCCLVVLSVIVSLIFFGKLVGVREGTVISALTVGFVMKRFQRAFQPALLKFVERDSKLEAATKMEEAAALDAGKLIITISREYGSEGYEIGKRLAERLGAEFYDEQLVELEAKESGLSVDFIKNHEQAMSHGIIYDFMTAGYAMYNTDLPPLEKLFAAQTKVIRSIAAEKDVAVIVGRCSDYILYNDPNSFRIFIHANPKYRAKRLAERLKVSENEAMRKLEKTDSARGRYYRHFAGREWGDMKYYNLAIDTEKFGVDASVDLIMEAVELRKKV